MKKITVNEFASQIGVASDDIPVIVKSGLQTVGKFSSLYKLPVTAMPGMLEAKIDSVTLKRDEIVIQIKPKAFNTK